MPLKVSAEYRSCPKEQDEEKSQCVWTTVDRPPSCQDPPHAVQKLNFKQTTSVGFEPYVVVRGSTAYKPPRKIIQRGSTVYRAWYILSWPLTYRTACTVAELCAAVAYCL